MAERLDGWANRIKCVVDSSLIDATQTDFRLLINMTTSSGIGDIDISFIHDNIGFNANRFKVAVTTDDGITQLNAEVYWDQANENSQLWVKFPTISDTEDTIFYIYFDSTQPDNTTFIGDIKSAVAESVWGSDFTTVWHMDQDPTGGAPQILDSTANDLHGTTEGMVIGDFVDGKIGKALNYDNSNNAINSNSANLNIIGSDILTVSVLCFTRAQSVFHTIFSDRQLTPVVGWSMGMGAGGNIFGEMFQNASNSRSQASSVIATPAWHLITNTYYPDNTNPDMYIDGLLDNATPSSAGNVTSLGFGAANVYVGKQVGSGTRFFDGLIDTIMVTTKSFARTAAYQKALFHNLFDILITYSSTVETMPLPRLPTPQKVKRLEIMAFKVTIHKTDGKKESISFDDNWEAQLDAI